MRLTSLEIKGFKSFGEKVIIHFDKGVTAIVGPNGSGKSNVVDAMRWVLGEQKTRMLRSEKMDNIIFNGTKERKPANLSEVSLTFENSNNILPTEFSNVCVTRRLYRSGESEYLLNGVACRLKDITDLFLDTGIGPDSYAIIELKMVDDILNDRNDTIKMLLEEAAGISKYKLRKKQTLSKLEDTDADLNRVNDLLFEIEKSLKQLESQAKKTDRYYRIKEEYKVVTSALALFMLTSFKSKHEDLRIKEQTQTDDKSQLHSQIEVIEKNIQQLKLESEEKEKALSVIQKQVNEKLIQLSQLESEEKNRVEKISYFTEKQVQLNRQLENDIQLMDELNISLLQLNDDKAAEDQRLKELETELAEMKKIVDESKNYYHQSLEELKQLNTELFNTRQAVNEFETKVAVRQARQNSINEEIRRINDQIIKNRESETAIESELGAAIVIKEQSENELNNFRKAKSENEDKSVAYEKSLSEKKEKLIEETRSADIKNNEYQLTKNLVEQMEGFPESIKFLKRNHSRYSEVPLLSEIIVCKDKYKVAIENYLEPFLNHFVVDTNQDAWEALDILSSSSKGRAHFFILDRLRNFNPSANQNINHCIHALDVIDTDIKYQGLMNLLLSHVYIIEDETPISVIEHEHENNVVILSQNGKFLRQKFTVGGGSIGSFDGKRTGRQKHLEKLFTEIEDHNKVIQTLKSEIAEEEVLMNEIKKLLTDYNQQISRLESDLNKINASVNTLLGKKDFLNSNIESNNQSIAKLENELNEIVASFSGDHAFTLDELRLKLNQTTELQKEKQSISNQHQVELSDREQKYNHHNISFLQQQNKIQNIVRDSGYKTSQLNGLNNNKIQVSEELEKIREQANKLIESGQELSEKLIVLQDEKKSLEEQLTLCEQNYFQSKADIDKEDKTLAEARKRKELTDTLIQSIHDEINDLKLKLNSLKERLQLEFEIDINDLIDKDPDPELNEEELSARSEKMKKQLTDFGPINPMALESFKEIKERYDFIVKEQTDLKNAKESLLKTMAEIDENAKEKFSEAYRQVRENFIRVFRSLFSEEDNCDLILSDINNPLESDIQIIAQPKGKKPLSIHQLSGGEKTLTATALLFGIYLLKPAPFCIFDEVDAPLDDNNIDKFNNIIKKFSDESQFIIITHNKKTMAATDIIYGITMNEPGVTSVVPVDLREYA